MIKALLYKLFGLEDLPCPTCEVLRAQLESSNAERKELLAVLLEKNQPKETPVDTKNLQPIHPNFVPWRVRQQMLEAEDREVAKTMRAKQAEMSQSIPELERELGLEEKTNG
jgi:hypothetical protein